MKAKFLKERLYKGRMKKVGEIVDMDVKTFNAYKHYGVVKLYIPTPSNKKEIPEKEKPEKIEELIKESSAVVEEVEPTNEIPPLDSLTVKELQSLCKKIGKKSTGKKQDLIDVLKDYYYHNDDS
jgi:hypothetical protein